MALNVVWTDRAIKQFRELSQAEQESVRQVIAALRENPATGQYDYTRSFPNNGQQTVYKIYGLLVKVRYTKRGLLGRKLALNIEEVLRTDLPSGTDLD